MREIYEIGEYIIAFDIKIHQKKTLLSLFRLSKVRNKPPKIMKIIASHNIQSYLASKKKEYFVCGKVAAIFIKVLEEVELHIFPKNS